MTRREAVLWLLLYLAIGAGFAVLVIYLFATNISWGLKLGMAP